VQYSLLFLILPSAVCWRSGKTGQIPAEAACAGGGMCEAEDGWRFGGKVF